MRWQRFEKWLALSAVIGALIAAIALSNLVRRFLQQTAVCCKIIHEYWYMTFQGMTFTGETVASCGMMSAF
jgi:hypothetical protein